VHETNHFYRRNKTIECGNKNIGTMEKMAAKENKASTKEQIKSKSGTK
jgi:hypothetical protein